MFPNMNTYDNIGLGLIFQMQGIGDGMRVQIWMENTFLTINRMNSMYVQWMICTSILLQSEG
jgi:hypothetical protein